MPGPFGVFSLPGYGMSESDWVMVCVFGRVFGCGSFPRLMWYVIVAGKTP